MLAINLNDQHVVISVGKSTEVCIRAGPPTAKRWVRQDVAWVPSVFSRPGQIKYLQLTNPSDRLKVLRHGAPLGLLMEFDMITRSPRYVSIGSRRYTEWQTLAFEANTE